MRINGPLAYAAEAAAPPPPSKADSGEQHTADGLRSCKQTQFSHTVRGVTPES